MKGGVNVSVKILSSNGSRIASSVRQSLLKRLAVFGVALVVAACGGSNTATSSTPGNDLLSKVKAAGVINIGLANDPPASIINPDGSVSGEGPVVVQMIMKKLGVAQVHGIVGTFGELVPGLQAGRWDMIGGVIAVAKGRCAVGHDTG